LRGISGHAARTAQTPASVTVALARPVETSTPGSPIVDWTDLRLETSAKQLAYGEHRISLLTRVPEGPLLFTPGTLEDHVATPFVSLAQTASGRALSLAVEGHPAGRSGCAANLQDQNFNVLASVQCDAGGERRKTVAVSARVARVRVVFQAARLEPGCLPARVRVLDHIG
jgi:hypothetical protein